MKRLLVVANPRASSMATGAVAMVVDALQRECLVDVAQTAHRRHAIELARAGGAAGYDAVVALGGDGTINEVANGLAGNATPMGCLPGGATNVYCRMLGIPADLEAASRHLLRALHQREPLRVDLGRLDDRWFTFSAGVGLDAAVVERVDRHPERKARLGPWYFTAITLTTLFGHYTPAPPRLRVDGRTPAAAIGEADFGAAGASVFVQNGRPYTYLGGLPIDLGVDGDLRSGRLSGAVLQTTRPRYLPGVMWRALGTRRQVGAHPRVTAFSGLTELRVRSLDGRALATQVDGDHLGARMDVRLSVAPGALRVIV